MALLAFQVFVLVWPVAVYRGVRAVLVKGR
jgi:hypothetical protein